MVKTTLLVFMILALNSSTAALADKITDRVDNSAEIYRELFKMTDNGIPKKLLQNCRAVAVIPGVKKGAFFIGAHHGNGIISVRNETGAWSPISFIALSGGSFGFQFGGQSADIVMFIMSERGVKSLLESKFTIGGDITAAAGPVGRTAQASTDIRLNADIYVYAKTKGLFAGIALDGSSLRPDNKAIKRFYGRELDTKQILINHQAPSNPPAAVRFIKLLP